jgi:hypothetical protein
VPRIPTYEAQGQANILQFPRGVEPESYAHQFRAGRQVSASGDTMQAVSAKLQSQQDDIDASGLVGDYEGELRGIQLETDQETTDAQERMTRFHEKATALQQRIAGQAKNSRVAQAFRSHVSRNYPVQRHSYNAHVLEYQLKQQFASLDQEGDRYSKLAAEAATPEDQDNYIKQYMSLLDKAEASGLVDPQVMQAKRRQFKEKAQLDYMNVLRYRDPDKLFELDDQGKFNDVNPVQREAILDRATRERAAKAARGQADVRRAQEIWQDSIERETNKHIADRTLTIEWIEEYGYAVKPETLTAWRKAYHDQQLGIGSGDPAVEREMQALVFNKDINPRSTLGRLNAHYARGQVGYEKYGPWVQHLNSEMNRRDGETKADRKEGETRMRELRGRRATGYLELARVAFRTTGQLDSFDEAASEALVQFEEEYIRRVDHFGGDEESSKVYSDLLQRIIPQVDTRLDSRLNFLRDQLGRHTTKEALIQDRATLGEVEYERRARYLREYQGIQIQKTRLDKRRKDAADAAKQGGQR